jgi:hypothetical protein
MTKYYKYNEKTLQFERTTNYIPFLWFCVFFNFLCFASIVYSIVQDPILPKVIHHYDTIKCNHQDVKLTDTSLARELTKLGCILPNVAIAQFREETGHFKSEVCLQNKNIAGIKTSRSKFVKGMNLNHCSYNSYRDCLKDYVRIQNYYLRAIDGKYAEAGQYINELKKFK